ncbi:MAG: hypothetical protein LBO67_05640 [Spirochaetaceae bacterium]|jgi:hypothetical protein|nr:hypothetical protein [Spirochaetaceae bacterium]
MPINVVMNQQINFEDNLFILTNMIRIIRDLCILNTAPEFFLSKTLSDLDFIDQTLGLLLTRLIGNIHLINRSEHLDNFSAVEKEYWNVLTAFMDGSGTVCAALIPDSKNKITALQDNSRLRSKAINEAYQTQTNREEDGNALVSSEEYNALLK